MGRWNIQSWTLFGRVGVVQRRRTDSDSGEHSRNGGASVADQEQHPRPEDRRLPPLQTAAKALPRWKQ